MKYDKDGDFVFVFGTDNIVYKGLAIDGLDDIHVIKEEILYLRIAGEEQGVI